MKNLIFGKKDQSKPEADKRASGSGMFNLVTSKLNQGKNQLLSRSQNQEPATRETSRGTMLLKSRDELEQPLDGQLDDLDEFDKMMQEQTAAGEDASADENQSAEPTSPRAQNQITTSGGDGLSFVLGAPNIFEMIDTIKYGLQPVSSQEETITDSELESPIPLLNDMDVQLEDLPEVIRPVTGIVEAVQQMEKLKESLRPQEEAEIEFLRVLRQLKLGDKIFTCSNSLELLVDKYKSSMHEKDGMVQKIEELEKQNFELKRDLTEKSTVVKYLQEQTKAHEFNRLFN